MDKTSDQIIRDTILQRLAEDPETAGYQIEVTSLGANVTLRGVVKSPAAKAAAEQVAKSLPEVVVVTDDIEIRPDDDPTIRTIPPFMPH